MSKKRQQQTTGIPKGAVLAKRSQQVPNNSYDPAPTYYIDKPFVCIDCGQQEVWTALQQKWYYEVAKGSLYATAIRCRSCRKNRSDPNYVKSSPVVIRNGNSLIKHVHSEINSAIEIAGFKFQGKSRLPARDSFSLDYSRVDLTLTCWFDSPNSALIAESIDPSANCIQIARVLINSPVSGVKLLDRISVFTGAVVQYLESLAPA
ncbi:zinc-ribbon domain-containing protein [Rubinisphaera italica]|uniref:Probable zinc-binding domain-containing protein n=1 Tax=Rubinisphaera italica TaxID=2527969 RepID=A0A5C5XJ10_9PLAN|nr:zinc-ribbon domain-containing protein [Rubinisphaera italica]TWT62774.1 hypothetical protein Pan54_35190 [Rubinisphaera italica]